MSDRYKALFSIKPYIYSPGVPVLICAGNLLWDGFSNRPCVQLKLQNLSSKVIQSVSVQIESMNYSGEVVETQTHIYNQLNIARDQFFGDQEVIPLNDTSGTSFSASVTEAVLYDGTVLIPDEQTAIHLPELEPLMTSLEYNLELEKQFKIENGKNHVYAPAVVKDIWRCSCGAINNEKEKICHNCRIASEKDLNPDLKGLKERCDVRVKIEAEERKRREKKAKQLTITGVAVAAAVAIIVGVFAMLIVPSSRYKKASQAYAEGEYETAYELYKKNGSFKDSADKAEESKQKYWRSEYNRLLTEGYGGDYFTAEDVVGDDCVFGVAYIDGDDMPELLVSPYGYDCYIFSIKEEDGAFNGASLVNTWLYLNSDDNYEIGYMERNGYVYSYRSDERDGEGYMSEFWAPLYENDNGEYGNVIFNRSVEKSRYFGDSVKCSVTYVDGGEERLEEDEFYEKLNSYFDAGSYKTFELFKNTEQDRQGQLGVTEANA